MEAATQQDVQSNKSFAEERKALGAMPSMPDQQFEFKAPAVSPTFASLMLVFGALAGRGTMQPMTAALNNMTGMMKGLHDKNLEAYKTQKEQYEMNYKHGMDKFNEYFTKLDALNKEHNYDMAATKPMKDILDLEYGKAIDVFKAKESMAKLTELNDFHTKELDLQAKKLGDASAPSSPESRQAVAGMVASGVPLVQAVPGWGASAVTQRKEARDDAIRQIMNETGLDATNAGVELAKREVDFVAGKSSVSQLTKMLGATRVAVSQLEKNLPNAQEAMKNMGSTDMSPFFNAIINKENQWSGDPEYASVFYFMNAIAMESARLQMGGQASIAQLHQGAADEAKQPAAARGRQPQIRRVLVPLDGTAESAAAVAETAGQFAAPGSIWWCCTCSTLRQSPASGIRPRMPGGPGRRNSWPAIARSPGRGWNCAAGWQGSTSSTWQRPNGLT